MEVFEIILSVFQFIGALFIIVAVLFQSGNNSRLGAIAGVADSFMSKSKAGTWDAKLGKMTAWVAAAFIFVTLVLSVI